MKVALIASSVALVLAIGPPAQSEDLPVAKTPDQARLDRLDQIATAYLEHGGTNPELGEIGVNLMAVVATEAQSIACSITQAQARAQAQAQIRARLDRLEKVGLVYLEGGAINPEVGQIGAHLMRVVAAERAQNLLPCAQP